MNHEKIVCVLAGYDAVTASCLTSMQQRLYEAGFVGTQTKDLPPHLTLGTFSATEEATLLQHMQETAATAKKVPVVFNHLGIFSGSKVLFVAPDVSEELLALQAHFQDGFSWTPHTTLLIDEAERIYRALPLAAEGFRPFQGCVERLHLYEFWPTRHIATLRLGGPNGYTEN